MKEIVEKLINNKYTVSTMESCTGGFLASSITDIDGASNVLKFSAVTYSNEYKIKMGVRPETIEKYSVYSIEVAREMAKNISFFSSSTYGIGITGKINKVDINNLYGDDNIVFICIYDSMKNKYYDYKIKVKNLNRRDNKCYIVEYIINKFKELLRDEQI